MIDEKSLEKVEDYGVKPTFCRKCNKKTISIKETSCFKCSECGKIK